MPHDWTTLFEHPDRLPLTRSSSPADVEAILGPPSARHRDGRITSLEYWPESAGVLWVFSWHRGALLSVETNYRERRAAPAALPAWVTAITRLPATLGDFRDHAVRAGIALAEENDGDGWTLVTPRTATGEVTTEAKFAGDDLYSLYIAWA
jgi:hypothetical protein